MTRPQDRFVVVLTTAGSDEQADALARALVDRDLAACVNIQRAVCSVYRWKGEVVREEEQQLVIKTVERLVPDVRRAVRELHSYEVPEILVLPISDGDPDYMAWVAGSVRR